MTNRDKKERQQIEQIIADAIKRNPEQTLEQLAYLVESEIGIRPSNPTILKILAGLGVQAKRFTRWENVN